jgi:hypothetical protein
MPVYKKPFLETVPGTVAAEDAKVTALAGAVPVIMAVRGGNDGSPSSASSPTATASPSPTEASPPTNGTDMPGASILIASPKSLDFGKILPKVSSPTQAMQLANTGQEPVTLGRILIIGPGAGAFVITDATCVEGQELAPDGTCDVNVRFSPPAMGDHNATLVVERQPGEPLEIPLSGTAGLL